VPSGAGLLDASAEGIVLEGRGAAVGARDYCLHQPILEVPGEAAALSVREGIAVCVVGDDRTVYILSDISAVARASERVASPADLTVSPHLTIEEEHNDRQQCRPYDAV
jgi:hypothetical protein